MRPLVERLFAGLAAVALVSGLLAAAFEEPDEAAAPARAGAKLAQIPGGGRTILPGRRVVAFYGAPGDRELGTLGIGTPDAAARRLRKRARAFARPGRPALGALELIATVAAASPGADGKHRTRQSANVIDRYLRAARRAGMLLLLDIQPGSSDFLTEAGALERWLLEPDVGLALDPEWRLPAGIRPGSRVGSVTAEEVNLVSAYLAQIVKARRLPQKLFVVHQFTDTMIEGRERVAARPGLATIFNVDGFGDRANKISKYFQLAPRPRGTHLGFKLFFKEDTGLMSAREVLRLRPPPDLVVYE